MEVLIIIVIFIILSVAAWYLGFDSTERVNSREWQRRERWCDADRGRVDII